VVRDVPTSGCRCTWPKGMKSTKHILGDWLKSDPRSHQFALYTALTWVVRPRRAQKRTQERKFYAQLLGKGESGVIFDLGAHSGSKTEIFYAHGSVICVEPSPFATAILRKRFARCSGVKIVEGAIADKPGVGTLLEFAPGSPYNTLHKGWADTMSNPENNRFGFAMRPEARSVRLWSIDELTATYGKPRYIKLDVEGFECSAIQGMSQSCELISAEFNLPLFWRELENVVARLEELGKNTARFNAVISDPPLKFEFPNWITGAEVVAAIRKLGWQYVELFCKTEPV
jgi:FkbM family methyltransferase